jgi:hypothetical protein
MSETTTTDLQGGADTPAEPAATETEAPAPAETGAVTETNEAEGKKESARPSREDRRWAVLSAKLSAAEQERGRMAAELDQMRRGAQPQFQEPQLTPDQQAFVDRRVQQAVEARAEQERVDRFHEAGRAAYGPKDWQERCNSLMQMGADQGLAALLVEAPDGARVAAALADDPEELERIAGLRTERARAIALGKFAAGLADRPAPQSRAVSKAPPPIKPISSGGARTEFNAYDPNLNTQQLVDFFTREAMKARGL